MSSNSCTKTIAVVGGGNVGATLANSIVGSGDSRFNVVLGVRNVEKTKAALAEKELDHLAVSPMAEAIASSDIIILAVPGGHTDQEIQAIAAALGNVQGKTIIDATNPLSDFGDGLQVRWAQGTSGGEVLQQHLPDNAKVYKAFNTLGVEHMARPKSVGVDMLYCGPDQAIADVVAAVGFVPRYMGPMRYARNLEAIAELWIHCAIPPLPAHQLGRDWTFALKGPLENQ